MLHSLHELIGNMLNSLHDLIPLTLNSLLLLKFYTLHAVLLAGLAKFYTLHAVLLTPNQTTDVDVGVGVCGRLKMWTVEDGVCTCVGTLTH